MAIQPTTLHERHHARRTACQDDVEGPGQLGKDDFLKLLVGQLQNQDPMNPTRTRTSWLR